MHRFITLLLILLSLTSYSQNTFTDLNGIQGGNIQDIQKDANGRLYVVEANQQELYYSDDNGANWILMETAGSNVYAILIDGNTLYYANWEIFYKSDDFGVTWNPVADRFSGLVHTQKLYKSPVSATTFISNAGGEGVRVSTDSGATWKKINPDGGWIDGELHVSIDANGNIYWSNPTSGVHRHKNPIDGIWDANKSELVFAKEYTDNDHSLSVASSPSGSIFITYKNTLDEFVIAKSSTGDSGSFGLITIPDAYFNSGSWSISPTGKLYLKDYNTLWELSDEATPIWTQKNYPLDNFSSGGVRNLFWNSSSEIFAGTEIFGVLRSTDGGGTWQLRNGTGSNTLKASSSADIEILPNGNIVIFPHTQPKGVWVSTDQGASFNFISFPNYSEVRSEGQSLIKLSDNSLICYSQGGTLKSTDGINWSIISTESFPFYVVDNTNIYTISDDGFVKKSTDGGVSWTTQTINGLPSVFYMRRTILHNGDIYLYFDQNGQNELWKLETSTATWQASKLITPIASNYSFTGMFSLNGKIYIGDGRAIFYSANEGVSWATINYNHNNIFPIYQEGGGIGLSTEGGLIVTQDDGKNWRSFSLSKSKTRINDIAQDAAGNFIVATQGGSIAKTSSKLILNAADLPATIDVSWTPLGGPFGGSVSKLITDAAGNLYAQGIGSVYKFNESGSKWERLVISGIEDVASFYIDDLNNLYALDPWGGIAKSADSGATWSVINPTTSYSNGVDMEISNNGNIIVISHGGGEGIYLSSDNGDTFSKPLGAGSKGEFRHLIKSGSGNLWVSQWNEGATTLWTSTDNGSTWVKNTNVDLSGGKEILSINKMENNVVTIVTTDDILRTTDDGATWGSIKGSITNFGDQRYLESMSQTYYSPSGEYYFSNSYQLYKSTDLGLSWSMINDVWDNYQTRITQLFWKGSTMYAGSEDDGIFVSNDDGITFSIYNNNDGLATIYGHAGSVVFSEDRIITVASPNGKSLYSLDNGQSFEEYQDIGYYERVLKSPTGSIIVYGSGIAVSDDSGATWTSYDPGYWISFLTTTDGITYYGYLSNHATQKEEFFTTTDFQNVSLLNVSGTPSAGFNVHDGMVNDQAGNIYTILFDYSTSNFDLYKIAFGSAKKVFSTVQNVGSYNGKIIAYSHAGILYTSTDGNNWVKQSSPSGNNFYVAENGYYFINTSDASLWLSRDEGDSWQDIGGIENSRMLDMDVNTLDGHAYAIVAGDVMYRSQNIIVPNDFTSPVLSGAAPINNSIEVPIDFQLEIIYDEPVKGVAGKFVKLLESDNPTIPIEQYDAANVTLSNGNKTVTITPGASLNYLEKYFVVIDDGAFTDIFGNPATGINNTTTWAFTTKDIPDNQPPTINFNPSDLTLLSGNSKNFQLTVTDNKSVDINSAKLYYRGISTLPSTAFKSVTMTGAEVNEVTADFTLAVSEAWYDAMGLEFYIEAKDLAGNIERSPLDSNQYYYSYIDYSENKPKIEGTSFGETASSYEIIAIPHDLIDNHIATQFDELGEPNKDKYRILSYTGGTEYDEFPSTKLASIGRGKGYWFLMRNFSDIFLENAKTPENNRNNFFTINLNRGWNMVGNPYTVPISWEETRAIDPDNVGSLKRFSNGNFSNADILQPYEGAIVYAQQSTTVKIRFKGISTGGRLENTSSNFESEHWELPIKISQGEFSSDVGGIGMSNRAIDGKDRYDEYSPPSISSRLELAFTSDQNLPFARSVVDKYDNYEWQFTAHAEGAGKVELHWGNNDFGNNNINLFLFDIYNLKFIDMRAENSYAYSGSASREFKIYYGLNELNKLTHSLSMIGNPYPNPSSSILNIPFSVSNDFGTSDVIISMYNTTGQLVKELVNGEYKPGIYTTQKQNSNISNKPGLYFLKSIIRSRNGESLSEIKKVLIR